ncbi:MAG: hypothetical protein ACU0CI_05735 [Shimia sp.]
MRVAALLFLILLTACGRALTPEERAFTADLLGPSFAAEPVRLVPDVPMRGITITIPERPRTTCRERIVPEGTPGEVRRASPAAVVAFNTMYMARGWSLGNFLEGYPERLNLYEAMLFGHEMVHVWQWQNRDATGYHPLRAAAEHQVMDDPYLFETAPGRSFLDYGYEQQGALMEEYICCAALDPGAARTARLRALLAPHFPGGGVPSGGVRVGWPDAQTVGICSPGWIE